MRLGRLDRRIALQRLTYTTGDYGQRVEGWTAIATVWANVDTRGGNESEKAQTEFPARKVIFTCRFRDDVGPDDRVVWDSDVYQIVTVEETHYTRKRYLKLHAILKGRQDG